MIRTVYMKVLSTLAKKPMMLWGLSLLGTLLTGLACFFGVLPIISIPIVLVLQYGMASVFLAGYRGETLNSDCIFRGFKTFWRTAGGMGWRALWTLIWSIIPIVGPILGIIKGYSYSFVPYIMLSDETVSGTEALRRSMKETEGYKGKMFGAEILVSVIIWVVIGLLFLLSRIPYVGILFLIILALFVIVICAFLPLVMGLIKASFYEEVTAERANAAAMPQSMFCPECGCTLPAGSRFCSNCGHRF